MQCSALFIVLVVCVAGALAACPGNDVCKSFGQSCTTIKDCAFGLYCNGGTCQNTKGQSSSCTSDIECSNNYACISEPSTCVTATPKWLEGKPLNEWFQIANTSGAGGAAIDAYSGFAYNELTNEIFIGAAGGHHDSYDNRVVSMAMNVDNPSWVIRMAASTNVSEDVAYYPDGKPTSRHTYNQAMFVPQVNRYLLFGIRGAYGQGWTIAAADGFNPSTNTWDPPGTYPKGAYYVSTGLVRATGEIMSTYGSMWSPVYNNWTDPSFTKIETFRYPVAHDSLRNQFYNLQIADGQGFGDKTVHSTRIPVRGTTQYNVTFNPSEAFNMFVAENPIYAAMDYDVDNDRFLFYNGLGTGAAGRVYVIKPNNGNNWDMSLFEYGPNSVPVAAPPQSGINGRFRYIPAFKGFLMLARSNQNLYFMRTSNATCASLNGNQRTCLPISNGPGMPCTQDGECYIYNSTINSRQKSTCLPAKKCFGLAQSATCSGDDQCNLGLVCKGSTCTSLASAGQACASQTECQFGLTCLKTSIDSVTKACVAFGQGTSGSYCEDSAFCGDNLYCDSTSKTCKASTGVDNCPNPSGFNQAVAALTTCYQSNLNCKGTVPCSSCSSQICSLYALAPQFMRTLCQDSPAKQAALAACPTQPATTGASSSKSTTTSAAASSTATTGVAAASTSGTPKTTTTSAAASSTSASASSTSAAASSTSATASTPGVTSATSATSSTPAQSTTAQSTTAQSTTIAPTSDSPIDSAAALVTASAIVGLLAVVLLL